MNGRQHEVRRRLLAAMNPLNLISPESRWLLIGLGLVFGSLALSWIAAMVLGGFKFGRLERRATYSIARDQYDAFWKTLRERLAELRFQAIDGERVYVQGGGGIGDVASSAHARTMKELRVQGHDDGAAFTVEMSLRYLDPIMGDSGESAYRDAVLDYVSGRTGLMRVVPNCHFGALSSFVGGVVACTAMLVLKFMGYRPVMPPIQLVAITEASLAILALIVIRKKPRELTGQWLAVAAIALSVLAVLGAMGL